MNYSNNIKLYPILNPSGNTGTDLSGSNALPSDVRMGKTFFSSNSDNIQTGTLDPYVSGETLSKNQVIANWKVAPPLC